MKLLTFGRSLRWLAAGAAVALPLCSAAQSDGAAPAPGAIRTKHATFEPAAFTDLPGWRDDSLADAMAALKQSCSALKKRSAWEEPCRRSASIAPGNDAALRQFFEEEFRLYQIRNVDGTPAGTITGYYEAQLNGSRRYGSPYIHPVHAIPDDLLYLDARTLPASGTVRVRIAGRTVVPLSEAESASGAGYLLDLGGTQPDTRTKRYRVRLDGERVTNYFSRDDITAGRMTAAKVIAWVDNPSALYSMQIQGSGKVRLPDGGVIRVAYGEQNGHPFMPSLQALPQLVDPGGKRQAITTRGLGQALQFTPEATTEGVSAGVAAAPAASRGSDVDSMIAALMPGAPPEAQQSAAKRPPAAPAAPTAPTAAARKNEDIVAGLLLEARGKPARPAKPAPVDVGPVASSAGAPDAVAALMAGQPMAQPAKPDAVSALQAGQPAPATAPVPVTAPAAPARKGTPQSSVKSKAQDKAQDKAALVAALQQAQGAQPEPVSKTPIAARPNTDPSYVFFRTINDSDSGPIGALGVPLTAGRSLAVDPRTTPLGVPVFISTTEPGKSNALNRLMMAQDTGGAITGAVRADFFWGFGRAAFARASQMKQNGRMWLLLPKNLQLGVKPGGILTRSVGGQATDCLVPDPELCVE
jgi:membrane-bound lytic murein transglycosylase A